MFISSVGVSILRAHRTLFFCPSTVHKLNYRTFSCGYKVNLYFQSTHCKQDSDSFEKEMELNKVVNVLKMFANTNLAEDWDNIGLLVEPSPPHVVKKVFLTNDLTPATLQEAIETGSNLVISYHPPIFSPLKRLTQQSWKEKLMVKCIENKMAVYSPHTSYDALKGGVNDWLLSAFDVKTTHPVGQTYAKESAFSHEITFLANSEVHPKAQAAVLSLKCLNLQIIKSNVCDSDSVEKVESKISLNKCDLTRVFEVLNSLEVEICDCKEVSKFPLPGYGMGRVGSLTSSITLDEAIVLVKTHLGLAHVRVATATDVKCISKVAVCAGSGSSVLRGAKADLLVTGEMSHHDVLNAVHSHAHVILCEHSNTERGYLNVVKDKLTTLLGADVDVIVSKTDSDPLSIA